jgi:hypothetical protein
MSHYGRTKDTPGKGQPPKLRVHTSHDKLDGVAAARHATVFDERTAIPIVTIAMSDYGRTKDTPGKG